jgi:hypothetical protein
MGKKQVHRTFFSSPCYYKIKVSPTEIKCVKIKLTSKRTKIKTDAEHLFSHKNATSEDMLEE